MLTSETGEWAPGQAFEGRPWLAFGYIDWARPYPAVQTRRLDTWADWPAAEIAPDGVFSFDLRAYGDVRSQCSIKVWAVSTEAALARWRQIVNALDLPRMWAPEEKEIRADG